MKASLKKQQNKAIAHNSEIARENKMKLEKEIKNLSGKDKLEYGKSVV